MYTYIYLYCRREIFENNIYKISFNLSQWSARSNENNNIDKFKFIRQNFMNIY